MNNKKAVENFRAWGLRLKELKGENNMNKKTFNFDIGFDCKNMDEGKDFFTFEGMGSTSDLDLTNDIVDPAAFIESLRKREPSLLWQHRTDEPLGVFTSIGIVPEGLKVAAKMPLTDSLVRDRVMPQMRVGSVKGLSIGFRVLEAEFNRESGVRTITKLELFEISLVTMPANPHAVVGLMKSYLADGADDVNSPDITREDYPAEYAEKSTPWDPLEDKKDLPAYSAAVDGVVKLIPRAIFAARVELDMPQTFKQPEDYTGPRNLINTFYKEMGFSEPFLNGGEQRGFCITELKNLSTKNVSYVIRYKELSKDAARYVTDFVMAGNLATATGDAETGATLDDIIKNLKFINEV